ncbi:alpha/beta hydrolase [Streptomyces melanosporofaciens]|uniref:Alpha/beta hydrolase fold n=1 Tax=Streptomyces melanosporofaciens TaxID=67327 RepID=A0A1H4KJF1_STRMJ|nr:alpha/beta hydrolase [Streptomyces melanosporofaciens]SEB58198.1 alpha/beta hydrolase fold [Streptomyces melanosporofaciens]
MPALPRHEYDPEIGRRIKELNKKPQDGRSIADFEALGAPLGPPEDWDLEIEDRAIPGPGPAIPVRIYRPAGAASSPRPCLVWLHGGAWVGGDLDMPEAHETARGVAGRADAVVVSVDYRLCSEDVHFPAQHDDVVAAYRWVRGNAADLGVDPARIALGGASAGGNLAAGATLRLRDGGETPWQALLLYPLVHAPLPAPSDELAAALTQVPAPLVFGNEQFDPLIALMLDGAPVETASAYVFPGRAEDLGGFPRPTSTTTSSTACAVAANCSPSSCVPPASRSSRCAREACCTATSTSSASTPHTPPSTGWQPDCASVDSRLTTE